MSKEPRNNQETTAEDQFKHIEKKIEAAMNNPARSSVFEFYTTIKKITTTNHLHAELYGIIQDIALNKINLDGQDPKNLELIKKRFIELYTEDTVGINAAIYSRNFWEEIENHLNDRVIPENEPTEHTSNPTNDTSNTSNGNDITKTGINRDPVIERFWKTGIVADRTIALGHLKDPSAKKYFTGYTQYYDYKKSKHDESQLEELITFFIQDLTIAHAESNDKKLVWIDESYKIEDEDKIKLIKYINESDSYYECLSKIKGDEEFSRRIRISQNLFDTCIKRLDDGIDEYFKDGGAWKQFHDSSSYRNDLLPASIFEKGAARELLIEAFLAEGLGQIFNAEGKLIESDLNAMLNRHYQTVSNKIKKEEHEYYGYIEARCNRIVDKKLYETLRSELQDIDSDIANDKQDKYKSLPMPLVCKRIIDLKKYKDLVPIKNPDETFKKLKTELKNQIIESKKYSGIEENDELLKEVLGQIIKSKDYAGIEENDQLLKQVLDHIAKSKDYDGIETNKILQMQVAQRFVDENYQEFTEPTINIPDNIKLNVQAIIAIKKIDENLFSNPSNELVDLIASDKKYHNSINFDNYENLLGLVAKKIVESKDFKDYEAIDNPKLFKAVAAEIVLRRKYTGIKDHNKLFEEVTAHIIDEKKYVTLSNSPELLKKVASELIKSETYDDVKSEEMIAEVASQIIVGKKYSTLSNSPELLKKVASELIESKTYEEVEGDEMIAELASQIIKQGKVSEILESQNQKLKEEVTSQGNQKNQDNATKMLKEGFYSNINTADEKVIIDRIKDKLITKSLTKSLNYGLYEQKIKTEITKKDNIARPEDYIVEKLTKEINNPTLAKIRKIFAKIARVVKADAGHNQSSKYNKKNSSKNR